MPRTRRGARRCGADGRKGRPHTKSRRRVDFAVITYTFDSNTNPYAQGVSAFGVYQNCAISAEFTCQEDFDGDAAQLLAVF